jgi:hypothetical protein
VYTNKSEDMKKGKTKVVDKTGKGRPDVDTVPAMLAEGEAVLNVGAAERMGRDNIKSLNQKGLRDMKMGGARMGPAMKKSGRLGAYQGVEMAYMYGTPKVMGMRGYMGGADKVMPMKTPGYAEGTDNAGASTPATAQEVNDAGTTMRRYTGMRGYFRGEEFVPSLLREMSGQRQPRPRPRLAFETPGQIQAEDQQREMDLNRTSPMSVFRTDDEDESRVGFAQGTENVPSMTPEERNSFERRRELSDLNEATPSGTFDDSESAGDPGSVTSSLNIARLREQYGMGQGFAMGTDRVKRMKMKMRTPMVYAADGLDEVPGLRDRLRAGLRGFREGGMPPPSTPPAAPPAPPPAAPAAPPAATAPAAAESVATRQAAAVERARMAMGERAATARQPMAGGAGGGGIPPSTPASAAAASPAAPAAPAASAAGSRILSGLRMAGRAALPLAAGVEAANLFNRGMQFDTGQGYGDLAEQMTVGTLPPQPMRQTPGSPAPAAPMAAPAAAPAAAADARTQSGLRARPAPAAAPAAAPAQSGLRDGFDDQVRETTLTAYGAPTPDNPSGIQQVTGLSIPSTPLSEAERGGRGGGGRGGRSNEEIFGVELYRGVQKSYPNFDFQNASREQLRALGQELSVRGDPQQSKQAGELLKDIQAQEKEEGAYARSVLTAASKAAGGGGKGGATSMKFFGPATVDAQGNRQPGAEQPDLAAAFSNNYLPQFAAARNKNPNQLTAVEKGQAKIGFDLNRAVEDYGLKTGNRVFKFTQPIDLNDIQFDSDLPFFRRLLGSKRGTASAGEGFGGANAAVRVTDGTVDGAGNRIYQELPVSFLEQNWMQEPSIYEIVSRLMQNNRD